MEVLCEDQLRRLKTHKYSSSGTSLIEPVFQVYWRWLVEYFPKWVAPNTITVVGLIINVFCTFFLLFHCPTATETAPNWVYMVNAVGLCIYQSLDAIHGQIALLKV